MMLGARVEISGVTFGEFSAARDPGSRYLENWTDISISKGRFRMGGRFSLHQPPASFGRQDTTWGLTHRFVEYQNGGFKFRIGNFYTLLGRGLVLRAFDHQSLRWDSNIDGAKLDYANRFYEIELLGGRPRKTRLSEQEMSKNTPATGKKLPALYGGQVRLKPLQSIHLGATGVYTEPGAAATEGFFRGSVFSELFSEFGTAYGEFAQVKYPAGQNPEYGRSLYVSASTMLGYLGLAGEYKLYKNFAVFDGLLSNPPTATREHLFTLLNRHQLVQNLQDERGYAFEMNYPFFEMGLLTASFSRTTDSRFNNMLQEAYSQLEIDDLLNGEWIFAGALQKEYSKRYLHAVVYTAQQLSRFYALLFTFEHLHARDRATEPDRMFYDQLLTIGLSKSPRWTLSLITEHSTDFTVDPAYQPGNTPVRHFYWNGGQLDVNIYRNFDLSIFAGKRRKGKLCAGGVCVVKPELEGVEVTLTGRF